MKDILYWIMPPLVGGCIGFLTNVIAIKMLFRPLDQVRIFGIRLPFTPGILPRQRHRLAVSIGAMVERELFTPAVLGDRLKKADVRESVKKSAALYTGVILSLPAARFLDGAAALGESFLPFLRDFAASPYFAGLLETAAGAVFESPGAERLREKSVNEILGLAEGRSSLEDAIADLLSAKAERIVRALAPWIRGAYPALVKSFVTLLRRPEIHRELEERGRVFLLKVILKLNVFQRFFISAAQYDKTLADRMGEIIDDLVAQLEETLESDDVKRDLLSGCEKSLAAFLSDPASSRAAARFLAGILRTRLARPLGELLDFFADILPGNNSGEKDIAGKAAGIFMRLFFPGGNTDGKNAAAACGDAAPALPPPFTAVFAEKIRERFGQVKLGDLFGIHGERKEALDSLAAAKIISFAEGRIAGILETVDVKTMVSERVDSLEMERVEGIILDVMARELKWIDIFGGILGFLIGIFQVLFTHLLRAFG
ncbi:MAG: DUF445 family protein [Treponema sp.]|nr:DUF445 family protein [Treponema sp.]